MATMSFTALRRITGFMFMLMLIGLCLTGRAVGQSTPLVIATSPVGMNHPTGWGAIWQTGIDSYGDWVVVDYGKGGVYEFPAGGGAAVTLAPPGVLGGYQNPLALIDPGNNLYLGGNWNNCLEMFPYNSAASPWSQLSALTPANGTPAVCSNDVTPSGGNDIAVPPNFAESGAYMSFSPYFLQPWGIALGAGPTANSLVLGNQQGGNVLIWSLPVTGAWTNPVAAQGQGTEYITGLTARANSIAVDPQGNIYFVEDSTSGDNFIPGVYEIPVSQVNAALQAGGNKAALTSDCPNPSSGPPYTGSSCLTRVDPNLPDPTAVVTDPAGNLYISDGTEGVFVVPNPSGTPQTSAAYQLSSVPAQGEVAIDWARNLMYVPTTQTQSNGQADVAMVGIDYAELGSSPVLTATASSVPVSYVFSGNVTPARFTIVEDGATSPDFAITGGTCLTTSPGSGGSSASPLYTSGTSCTESITMTPHSVGNISAKLLMQTGLQVPTGQPGASASVTQYSVSGNVVSLTANNSFVANQWVTFSGAAANSVLAPLNGQGFYVLPTGLSSQQFSIQSSAVAPQGSSFASSGSATISAAGYEFSTVSSFLLHGTGLGALMQASPAQESEIGGSLMTPSQVAVDGHGDVYVADAGLGKVLMYPAGSGTSGTPTSIGTGLTKPTGVAVDAGGDVFIADSGSGSVYEIPFMATGLLTDPSQVTLASGLGNALQLAVDGVGDVYVADPSNGRVVKLSRLAETGAAIAGQQETILKTGFNAPSAVAVGSNNNLYVLDGSNLFKLIAGAGTPTTLLSSLSGATGIAIDPSGAVYISGSGGTSRIPLISGSLVSSSQTAIAADVTSPTSVALDNRGNVYLADGAALNIHVAQANGALTFTPFTAPNQSASLDTTVTNAGNAPLSVTGYSATNPTVDTVPVTDFTAADGSCMANSPVAVGATCQVDVTLAPGPGEQGALSSTISFAGNSANTPVINATGTAYKLAGTTTSATVVSGAQVINTQINVTIAPTSSSAVKPTGTVGVTYTTWTVAVGTSTIQPVTNTVTETLTNGAASFTLAPIMAGAQNITVEYIGDEGYGRSTMTLTPTIAKSAITSLVLDPKPPSYLPFVLESGSVSGSIPYDGSVTYWQYSMPIAIATAAGIPTGTITMMDNSSTCPPGTSTSGQGAATCALANYTGVACPEGSGGVVPLLPTGSLISSQANFETGCLQMPQFTTYTPVVSTHYVTPVYSGDANFQTFTGTVPTLFQALRSPLITITSAPASMTVGSGSTVSATLTLNSLLGYGFAGKGAQLNDFNFPVTLTCDNLPPHTACTFTYPTTVNSNQPSAANSVQIPCSGSTAAADNCLPGVVTLTLTTDVTVGTTTSRNAAAATITLGSLFGFGMIGLFFRRKAFEKGRLLLMVVLMLVGGALAVSLTACNTDNLTPNAVLTTQPGAYAVTVTAQQVGYQCIPLVGPGANCTTASGGSGIAVNGSENQVSLPFYINVTVQ